MSKIAIAKGTLIVVILVAILVAGGVSAGITVMVTGPPGTTGPAGATDAYWKYVRVQIWKID